MGSLIIYAFAVYGLLKFIGVFMHRRKLYRDFNRDGTFSMRTRVKLDLLRIRLSLRLLWKNIKAVCHETSCIFKDVKEIFLHDD